MPGKKIIGSGSTENKVIRLADHVAGLETGGGGLPRFIEALPVSADAYIIQPMGLESLILLTEGKRSELLASNKPVFDHNAINVNDFFGLGFESYDDYKQFVISKIPDFPFDGPPMSPPDGFEVPPLDLLRFLVNYEFYLVFDCLLSDLSDYKSIRGLCVTLSKVVEGEYGELLLYPLANMPCHVANSESSLALIGSGSCVVNEIDVDFSRSHIFDFNGNVMESGNSGFAGLALSVGVTRTALGLTFEDRDMLKKAKLRTNASLLSGDSLELEHAQRHSNSFFSAAVLGPEKNHRFKPAPPPFEVH